VTADVAVSARLQRGEADVTELLGSVSAPTLVIHSRGDRMTNFAYARFLASHIPGARLVPLESDNHIVLEDEAAWPVYVAELRDFLAEDRTHGHVGPAATVTGAAGAAGSAGSAGGGEGLDQLSTREVEILRLASEGLDNDVIARELTLSVRTVERHLSNVYAKLDLHGKSARTAAVARLLTRA
jgi:DNA-binding CsgD family transcriptional regulator